eukprot:scaffold154779_cov45-Prasinocladus_malaysianus.AAC.1
MTEGYSYPDGRATGSDSSYDSVRGMSTNCTGGEYLFRVEEKLQSLDTRTAPSGTLLVCWRRLMDGSVRYGTVPPYRQCSAGRGCQKPELSSNLLGLKPLATSD